MDRINKTHDLGVIVASCLSRIILPFLAITFVYKLWKARTHMRALQRKGMPMPPHHWLFGHLLIVGKIFAGLPPNAQLLLLADEIRKQYPQFDEAFYLDLWPFGPASLWVLSPHLAAQFTQERSLPKFPGVRKFLKPLTGKKDLVTMEGADWKQWRSRFNPGFSTTSIMSRVPDMIKDLRIYRDAIRNHAVSGNLFHLETVSLDLSMDIIGRIVLDHELHCQTSDNQLASALLNQALYCNTGLHSNPLQYLNFWRPLIRQYNTWRMNSYLRPILEARFKTVAKRPGSKVVADLIMNSYIADPKNSDIKGKMDAEFSEFMRSQVKLFLHAGHDTTAATIVYTIHMLQKHPESLKRLRAELKDIFGEDRTNTCDRLEEDPHLLNKCEYLQAAVKETLRLFPPSASARFGKKDISIVDTNGTKLPTENCLVTSSHWAIHRNPKFWPQAERFLPDRWLVEDGDPLYPVKNGWRPFERGPRNCIGQEIAMIETKLVVAMLVREFDVKNAYDEVDLSKAEKLRSNLRVNGERAYPVTTGGGGGHPSDNFPCRVTFAQDES